MEKPVITINSLIGELKIVVGPNGISDAHKLYITSRLKDAVKECLNELPGGPIEWENTHYAFKIGDKIIIENSAYAGEYKIVLTSSGQMTDMSAPQLSLKPA